MRRLHFLSLLLLVSCATTGVDSIEPAALSWEPVTVPALQNAGLRGLSLPEPGVIWISGGRGLCATSRDDGATWRDVSLPVAREEALDLRSIHAFDDKRAVVASAGPGEASRIFRTVDAGRTWESVLVNRKPEGFFDSIAFWDESRGVCFGDPTDGRLTILITKDGGATWERIPAGRMPRGITGEAGFAASNGCISLADGGLGWIGTGGASARVLRTGDFGEHWGVLVTPIRRGGSATGIFALEFDERLKGVAVGGEYTAPSNDLQNCAFSIDGGRNWRLPSVPPRGYRSSVDRLGREGWIAVGITGTDVSMDGGDHWRAIGDGADIELNAVRVLGRHAWAVGPEGRVVRMRLR